MSEEEQEVHKPLWAKAISAITLTIVFSGIILAIIIGAHYGLFVTSNVLETGETKTVVVPRGSAWKKVVRILEREGVIDVGVYFDFWARQRGLHMTSKAGTYKFTGPMTLEELAKELTKGGQISEKSVTIPEGYSVFKIADKIAQSGVMPREDFLRGAKNGKLMKELGVQGETFEGYLFPDTYKIKQGSSGEAVVRKLHNKWKKEWEKIRTENAEAYEKTKKDFGFDDHDIVTLASIVERETGYADERPLIAKVFLNRIKKGMRLQTDPTCVYGEKTYLEVPTPKTCKDPLNRYSTYVIDGLPPGPIANPSREALLAVIKPSEEKGSEKLFYFCAKNDDKGSHHFSKTLAEHTKAVAKYLKGEGDKK